MSHSVVVTSVLVLSLALGAPSGARAGEAIEQLKPEIGQVIKVLENPALKGEAKTRERRDALRRVGYPIFDWTQMAQRSLGRHWQQRTPSERDEFVGFFRDLMMQTYITTIERYSGEQIFYLNDSIQGDEATVNTKFLTKQGQEVSITYRLSRQGGRWLVYDVLVASVSLVANYRAQFDQIIQTSSYPDLLRRIKTHEIIRKSA